AGQAIVDHAGAETVGLSRSHHCYDVRGHRETTPQAKMAGDCPEQRGCPVIVDRTPRRWTQPGPCRWELAGSPNLAVAEWLLRRRPSKPTRHHWFVEKGWRNEGNRAGAVRVGRRVAVEGDR